MSAELFTTKGQRKYLGEAEHTPLAAATALERCEVRTLCTTLAHTGCRLSEALELTAERVDLSSQVITFRSLKNRGKSRHYTGRFRSLTASSIHSSSCTASGRFSKRKGE